MGEILRSDELFSYTNLDNHFGHFSCLSSMLKNVLCVLPILGCEGRGWGWSPETKFARGETLFTCIVDEGLITILAT